MTTGGLRVNFATNTCMAHNTEAMMGKSFFKGKDHDSYSVEKESIRDNYVMVHFCSQLTRQAFQ